MSCPDLIAEVADMAVRMTIDITTAEDIDRATALLSDASSMVRSITGRPFGINLQTTVRLQAHCGLVRLEARDIVSVDSVTTIGGVDLTGTWDGLHNLLVGVYDQFDVEPSWSNVVDVTYTRRAKDAPDWVKGIVVQMAARAFGRPPEQSGVSQEAIAGYSYTVGSAAAAGGVGLLPYELQRLEKAFPKTVGSIRLGVWHL